MYATRLIEKAICEFMVEHGVVKPTKATVPEELYALYVEENGVQPGDTLQGAVSEVPAEQVGTEVVSSGNVAIEPGSVDRIIVS